ncbi:MAG: EAL domain-containing protein [Thiotrichales bacterium]|nr:EAL domain-containing protein [Thiotrichales bacterium]
MRAFLIDLSLVVAARKKIVQERKALQILMIAEQEAVVAELHTLLSGVPDVSFEFTRISPGEITSGRIGPGGFDIGVFDITHCDSADVNSIARLHRKFPGMPLIVMNETENPDYSLQVLQQGAQDYLVKTQVDADRLMCSMQYAIERSRHIQTVNDKAAYEPLTGLANRLLLNDRLQQALNRARRNKTGVAVINIAIDNFRNIEQRVGRCKADILLKLAADSISQCIRNSDTLARVGADEFVILLEEMNHSHGAVAVSDKILTSLGEGVSLTDETYPLPCSAGIALFPQCGNDIEELICKADITRCRASREGGNRYCIYTEDVESDFVESINIQNDLVHALEREEFRIFYQPKFNLNNGRISGSEALLRWQHPRQGLLLPESFMQYIEDKDIMRRVGDWVLEKACMTNKQWHESGLCVGPVAVNIAGKQLIDVDFVSQVKGILNRTGLPSCLLELEITERTLLENVELCSRQLQALRDLGVSIAIDDFGTGYSSFNYLKNFLIDTVKIDRVFIEHINEPGPEAAITTAIVRLARDLKVNVVAEGIENLEQFKILYEMAADEIQGNFLSPPMSADSMKNYMLSNGLELNVSVEPDLRMAV